jgi:NodT family efflux transporter outer membrane factor (OMF) lipoprotein
MNRLFPHLCLILAGVLALDGCAVGPDFRPPDPVSAPGYTAAPLPARTASAPGGAGAAQQFDFAGDLSSQWWTLFRSPELDGLVRQAVRESPSLASAEAALRKAREDLRASQGALLLPAVDAGAQATRQRTSGSATTGPSDIYNLYNTSVSVSYTLDLFGASRRRIEALRAEEDHQRFLFEATYLSLTGNIVTTAIRNASLREQIRATGDIIAAQRKHLEIVEAQFELGAASRSAVLSQQAELAATRALLPPLEGQLAATEHALSVLTGRLPAEGSIHAFRLDSIHLPASLPVSLPSALARQRPDIRAAEALLHQASAEIGVATANLFPKITLSAGYGYQAVGTGLLFSGESVAWNLGAGLLQPLFRGGELLARRRGAVAAYDRAAADYRQTVLKAFQNVADALRALETGARALREHAEAEEAARAALDLTEKQYELGAANYVSLLTAQRDYQRARISVITARAQRFADTAALFQALGGGWWNREPRTEDRKE